MAVDNTTNVRSSFLLQSTQQSRIPVPVSKACSRLPMSGSSRIPVSKHVSLKIEPRASLVEKLPNQRTNIIKPIVTKRAGPPFKEFKVVKAGTKSVIKKKNTGIQKKSPQKLFRQTTLPENYFTCASAEKQNTEVTVQESTEKENAPPGLHVSETKEQASTVDIRQKTAKNVVEIQKQHGLKFEPNEFYRNQILSNKEVTLSQLVPCSPLKFDDKNGSDASAFALENMKKLTISKPKLSVSSVKRNPFRTSTNGFCKSVQKLRGSQENFQFGCTWSPRISNVDSPSKPDPFQVAMASIKRLSVLKTHSLLETKSKNKDASSPQSSKKFYAYHEALRRIEELNGSHPRKEFVKTSDICTLKESACAVKSPRVVSCMKSLDTNKSTSVYRPLENLKVISFKSQSQRLTDISEHSESDGTNSLSQSISDIKKENENSVDQQASKINDKHLDSSDLLRRNSQISGCLSQKHSIFSYLSASPKVDSCSSTKKQLSPSYLHTPRPLSFYSSERKVDPVYLFNTHSTKSTASHPAPICTPLVLQTIARENEERDILSPVKLRLNFNDGMEKEETKPRNDTDEEGKWEGRFSSYTKHILTKSRMEDFYADEECSSIMTFQQSTVSSSRLLLNPVARILSEGDTMHFVPISADIMGYC